MLALSSYYTKYLQKGSNTLTKEKWKTYRKKNKKKLKYIDKSKMHRKKTPKNRMQK